MPISTLSEGWNLHVNWLPPSSFVEFTVTIPSTVFTENTFSSPLHLHGNDNSLVALEFDSALDALSNSEPMVCTKYAPLCTPGLDSSLRIHHRASPEVDKVLESKYGRCQNLTSPFSGVELLALPSPEKRALFSSRNVLLKHSPSKTLVYFLGTGS